MYICVVCGFDKLDAPQYFEDGIPDVSQICPCCGFQAGYDDDDRGLTTEQYRYEWKEKYNNEWFDKKNKPDNWDLEKQLKNLKKLK